MVRLSDALNARHARYNDNQQANQRLAFPFLCTCEQLVRQNQFLVALSQALLVFVSVFLRESELHGVLQASLQYRDIDNHDKNIPIILSMLSLLYSKLSTTTFILEPHSWQKFASSIQTTPQEVQNISAIKAFQ